MNFVNSVSTLPFSNISHKIMVHYSVQYAWLLIFDTFTFDGDQNWIRIMHFYYFLKNLREVSISKISWLKLLNLPQQNLHCNALCGYLHVLINCAQLTQTCMTNYVDNSLWWITSFNGKYIMFSMAIIYISLTDVSWWWIRYCDIRLLLKTWLNLLYIQFHKKLYFILTFNPMTQTLKDESKCTLFQSSLKNVTKVLRNIPFIQFRIFVTQQSQIRLGIFFLLLLQIKEKDFADLLQDICHLCLKRSSRL